MTKRLLFPLILAVALAVVPVALASTVAYARDDTRRTDTEQRNETETENETENETETENEREHIAETDGTDANKLNREDRLEANKLRVCEKRQDQLKSMIDKVSTRGTKQLEVFKKIADKTKQFYTNKGYSATGYDALVGEVDAAYDTAFTSVNATTTMGDSWSCDGDNPKQAMSDFKAAKTNEVVQLKAYKDKVRELILLVKKAANSDSDDTTEEAR